MRIYCEINSGQLSWTVGGPALSSVTFTLKDILTDFEICFLNGTELVTSTVLAGGKLLKASIKSRPGATTLLAIVSAYVLSNNVATTTFDLNTTSLLSYFTDNVPNTTSRANFVFEVQVCAADNSNRQTFAQLPCIIQQQVNDQGDSAPTHAPIAADTNALCVRMDIVLHTGGGATALDSIKTTNVPLPWVVLARTAGALACEFFRLDVWDGVSNPNGTTIINPVDYDAGTNARQWKKLTIS